MYKFLFCVVLFWSAYYSLLFASDTPKVSAVGLDEKGNRLPTVDIVREEVEEVTFLPILPYIFFEKNESNLRVDKYKLLTAAQASYFSEKGLQKSAPLTVYRSLLNIIGKRLRENKLDTLRIIGYADGTENSSIASLRAKAVQDYFVSVWSINPNRLPMPTGKKRAYSSDIEFAEQSREENRCVEFVADWRILRPIEIRDTIFHITPPKIEFQLDYENREQIVRAELKAWQNTEDTTLYSQTWGELKEYDIWDVEQDKEHQPKTEQPLMFRFYATDSTNREIPSNEAFIPVEQRSLKKKKTEKIGGKEVFKFNLILFDFNSSSLTDFHKRIVEIIYNDGRILPSSEVSVSGFSDAIGKDEMNRKLSEERAKSITNYLLEKCTIAHTKPPMIQTIGNGETDLYKDQWKTPESRMYCRTVQIVIKNTISYK
jgi:outer membrane protein OmpA-like peptidoglycan-associated protein